MMMKKKKKQKPLPKRGQRPRRRLAIHRRVRLAVGVKRVGVIHHLPARRNPVSNHTHAAASNGTLIANSY